MDEHPQRSQGEAGSWELGGTPRVESDTDSLPMQLSKVSKGPPALCSAGLLSMEMLVVTAQGLVPEE